MADSTTLPGVQQKLVAEVVGTFVLVLFGCGSVAYATQTRAVSTITTVGLTFGIAVMAMVYAFGRVSGGHFNPAVSVGAAVGGRISWRDAGLYVLAQVVGAFVGALVLFLLMHGYDGYDSSNMGQNTFGDQGSGYAGWAAFLVELVMTAVFVMVILAVTDERFEHPGLAPLTIGLTLAAIHFVTLPATGTSVNPARSFGPALFAGPDAILQLWVFVPAPLVGGIVAGLGYPLLFGRSGEAVAGSGLGFLRARPAVVVGPDQYQQQWNQETGTTAYSGYSGYAGNTGAYGQQAGSQAQQPIVQDGWQWDPVGQQWHPVGQTPEQWRAQQALQEEQAARAAAERAAEDEGPGEQTQIRPPQ